jgi:hypothetical protein
MITNDYIQGYIAALKTLESRVDDLILTYESERNQNDLKIEPLKHVKTSINDIRKSYKELVQRLNNGQKKK